MGNFSPTTSSSLRPDTTPEQARDIRARAWRFVFDCYEKKRVTQEEGLAYEEESNAPVEHDGRTR